MKKIISKIFACLAVCVFALGAVSLVACGEKENPTPTPPAPTSVANKTELETALAKGGSIKLTENITDIENTTYTIDKDVTLDLNGKNITSKLTEGPNDLFYIAGGKLTVNASNGGSITISDEKEEGHAAGYIFYVGSNKSDEGAAKKGELVINGGEFKVDDSSVAQLNYGKITINGGKFETTEKSSPTFGSNFVINRLNSTDDYYTNETRFPSGSFNYDNDVVIVINGGSFKGFNPKSANAAAHDPAKGENGYLGEGKEAVEGTGADEGWYIVQDKAAED